MKKKEFGPPGARPWRPIGSANGIVAFLWHLPICNRPGRIKVYLVADGMAPLIPYSLKVVRDGSSISKTGALTPKRLLKNWTDRRGASLYIAPPRTANGSHVDFF